MKNTRYPEITPIPSEQEINAGIARARYERSMMFRSMFSGMWRAISGLTARPEPSATSVNRGTIGVTERSMKASVDAGENIRRWLAPSTDVDPQASDKSAITARAA